MRPNLLLFTVLLVSAWLLRLWLSSLQMRRYRLKVKELSLAGRGFVGSGRARRRWGAGAVAIILADPQGLIQRAAVMRGATVFARFRDFDALKGTQVSQLIGGGPERGLAGGRLPETALALKQAARAVVNSMNRMPE